MTIQNIVLQFYPTMSTREVAALHGVSPNAVSYWARKLRVTHTPDTIIRLRRKVGMATTASLTPEARLRKSERMRRIWAVERFRLMSGMPPKTRYRPAALPRRLRDVLYRLCHRYDYFSDTDVASPLTLFYDRDTIRCRAESRFTAKYGIIFLPADDGTSDDAAQPDNTSSTSSPRTSPQPSSPASCPPHNPEVSHR